ncbi:MAG: AAA family ATPase [Burkholderiaceae bacterium]|nr:AAA family ATPase [Burkholderiaceae bacterium]
MTVPILRVEMLGRFAVVASGGRANAAADRQAEPQVEPHAASQPASQPAWQRAAPRRLLKWLALAPRRTLPADVLMRRLWPDDDSPRRRQRLHHIVYLLRSALASTAPGVDTAWVEHDDAGLRLSPFIEVDVDVFEQALAAARADAGAHADAAPLLAALAHYRGPLLPGETDDEAINQRRIDLEQRFADGWAEAARRHRARGAIVAAIDCLQRVVALVPADEAAHCALIELHAQQGRRDRVEQQYLACKAALAAEFDVLPSARTHQAYRAAMGALPADARHAGDRSDVDATDPRGARPAALPPLPGPLIGRDDALAALCTALSGGAQRLVTLVGPGGVGKTRLALHAAHALAATRLTAFAALAEADTPEAVIDSVLRAVGVQAAPTQAPHEALTDALRDRTLLLVLDNCEQVAAALGFLSGLLARCPELTVLATSRRRLNLQAEQGVALAGLAATPQAGMRLFDERARMVQPGFDARAHADDVGAIVQQLDGLPLAIELVAARAHVYSPSQLRAALTRSLAPASGGGPDRPPRQRSLEDSLRWSVALLDAPARSQLACAARFAGAFDAAALRAVAAQEEPLFGSALQTLLELHLVAPAPAATDAPPRLALLPGLRSALESMITAPDPAADGRFVAWFADRAGAADAALDAPGRAALASFEADRDNLFAALALADASGDAAALCRLVRHSVRYWIRARSWDRARGWAQRAQTLAPQLDTEARVPLLLSLAMFWIEAQEFERARDAAAQVMALTEAAADLGLHLRATLLHSAASLHLGQGARAIPTLQHARRLARAAGESAYVPAILNNLGTALLAQGELARAQRAWRTAERASEPGAPQRVSLLHNLSLVAHYRGHLADALALSERAEQAHAQGRADRPARLALLLVRRSWMWSCQGDAAQAQAALAPARQAAGAVGLDVWERVCTAHAGKAALVEGRPAQAAALLQQGLAACTTLADRWDLLDLQLWLFWAQRALPGQAERARQSLAQAVGVARGAFLHEHARVLEAAAAWLWHERRLADAARAWHCAEALRQQQGIRRFPIEQRQGTYAVTCVSQQAGDALAWLDAALQPADRGAAAAAPATRPAVRPAA